MANDDGPRTGSSTKPAAGRRGPYAKSAHTRRAILEAALQVFAENGYRGGSLRAIADQIGVSQPLIFHYFSSKAALLTAVLELRDELALDMSPLDPTEPVEAIRKLAALMRHNASQPGIIALHCAIAGEAIAPDHPAHEFFCRRYRFVVDRLTQILQRCQEIGRLADGVQPHHAARGIVAAMDGLQVQWLLDPNEDLAHEFETYLRTLVDLSSPGA